MAKINPKIKMEAISSEMELLLLLSFIDFSEEKESRVLKLLQTPIDWDLLFQMAIGNRVYPLVYKNLISLGGRNINTDFLSKLEREYRKNTFQALQQTSELVKVMSLLEKSGIHAVSIKGPILGLSLYGDVSMRTSKDLDILIDLSDIDRVSEILITIGYKSEDLDGFTYKQKSLFMKVSHHISFRNQSGVLIELHWRFYDGTYDLPFQEIWENSVRYPVAGSAIPILGNEENFIYLAVHGSVHAWKRLRWLCDIRDMVTLCDLDWSRIHQRMKALGISPVLGQTLFLMDDFFHVVSGQSIKLSKKDFRIADQLTAMALPFIQSVDKDLGSFGSDPLSLPYKKYLLAERVGLRNKIQFIINHFYPSKEEYDLVKIKDRYFFLYYFILPFVKIHKILQSKKRQASSNACAD